ENLLVFRQPRICQRLEDAVFVHSLENLGHENRSFSFRCDDSTCPSSPCNDRGRYGAGFWPPSPAPPGPPAPRLRLPPPPHLRLPLGAPPLPCEDVGQDVVAERGVAGAAVELQPAASLGRGLGEIAGLQESLGEEKVAHPEFGVLRDRPAERLDRPGTVA